jgi:hypothetical protein
VTIRSPDRGAYASRYDRGSRRTERWFFGERRARLCALAKGNVLELAVGTGLGLLEMVVAQQK